MLIQDENLRFDEAVDLADVPGPIGVFATEMTEYFDIMLS